jgi:hypothetical protein
MRAVGPDQLQPELTTKKIAADSAKCINFAWEEQYAHTVFAGHDFGPVQIDCSQFLPT